MPHGISIYQNWTVVTWLFLWLVFSEFFVVDLPGQEVSVELPVEDEDTTDSVINPDLDKRAYHEETVISQEENASLSTSLEEKPGKNLCI